MSSSVNYNICLFNTNKDWGGGEKWHLEQAIAFKKHNINVTIACRQGSPLYENAIRSEIPVFVANISNLSFLNPIKIIQFCKWLKKNTFSHIIFNLPSDLKLGSIAGRLAGGSKLIYRRGSAIPIRASFINQFIFKHLVDLILANSNETKRTILDKCPTLFPPEKIVIVYNGINPNLYQSDIFIPNSKLISDKEPVVIGTVGRLVYQKGQEFLIDLAEVLSKAKINFKLRIGGQGILENDLKRKTQELGLDEFIEFHGFITQPMEFISKLDIFILPSRWEGFGYVIAEAMLVGKPVIAWNISSNPELIENGKTGFLIHPFQINEMAEKVKELISNRELTNEFGRNGRNKILQQFNSASSFSTLLKVLNINIA